MALPRAMLPANEDGPPVAFPSQEERGAIVLEFQRLLARMTHLGLMSRNSSTRLMRAANRQHARAEEVRSSLPKLILEALLSIEDGTLEEGTHYLRTDGLVALHLESMAAAMFHARRSSFAAREMRRLFHFGWLHFRQVVVARSERVTFGPEEDRRRAVILDVAKANEFVGNRRPAVPLG